MHSGVTFSSLPEAYHLQKITWQLFGTITMKKRSPSRRHILTKLITTVRQVCRVYSRNHAKQIMLFCRIEKGAESLHAHFLMAGIPDRYDSHQFGLDFARRWERRVGNCKVEPYDPDKDGIGYLTKCSSRDEDRDARITTTSIHLKWLGLSPR